jgi:uncharacterized protein
LNSIRQSSAARQLIAGLAISLRTSPLSKFGIWAGFTSVFAFAALGLGFWAGLYTVELLDLRRFWYIPILVLIFPSIPEEIFFRGLMIPRDTADRPWTSGLFYSVFSAAVFTLSRPLYALTIDPNVNPFFLNPPFLLIVFLLGITCSLGYIVSRSIWVPVIIHWLTALFWLLFLGGGSFALVRSS